MLATTPQDTMAGVRDRCVLLVGFALAARRSELVAVDVGDLTDGEACMVVAVRRSKTDQQGVGARKVLPVHTYIRHSVPWHGNAAMRLGL